MLRMRPLVGWILRGRDGSGRNLGLRDAEKTSVHAGGIYQQNSGSDSGCGGGDKSWTGSIVKVGVVFTILPTDLVRGFAFG